MKLREVTPTLKKKFSRGRVEGDGKIESSRKGNFGKRRRRAGIHGSIVRIPRTHAEQAELLPARSERHLKCAKQNSTSYFTAGVRRNEKWFNLPATIASI